MTAMPNQALQRMLRGSFMKRFLAFAIAGVGLMAGYFAITRIWMLISWACIFAIITLPFVFVFFHKLLSKRFGWVCMIASFFVLSWILSIGAVEGHFNILAAQVDRYQDAGLEAPAPLLHDFSSDSGRPFVYVFGWLYMAFMMPFALLAYLAVSIFKSLSPRFKAPMQSPMPNQALQRMLRDAHVSCIRRSPAHPSASLSLSSLGTATRFLQ
jgi:hypothetical protein